MCYYGINSRNTETTHSDHLKSRQSKLPFTISKKYTLGFKDLVV